MIRINEEQPSKGEIRVRRRRFLILFAIFALLFATPAMQALAANINLGDAHVAGFTPNAFVGSGICPGETIAWKSHDAHANYQVDVYYAYDGELDGAGLPANYYQYPDYITCAGSGNDVSVQIRTLATASAGIDQRIVAYYELFRVLLDAQGEVQKIYLVAHYPGEGDEEPAAPPHEHYLYWKETIPATEDAEGEICYLCDCGYVEYRIPTSANAVFIQNTINKIVKAPYGSTVDISTVRWSAFTGAVAEAFAKRPDVSMNLTFRQFAYRGNRLKTTIPAGSDLTQYLDENGYVGFNTLAAQFGAVRVP